MNEEMILAQNLSIIYCRTKEKLKEKRCDAVEAVNVIAYINSLKGKNKKLFNLVRFFIEVHQLKNASLSEDVSFALERLKRKGFLKKANEPDLSEIKWIKSFYNLSPELDEDLKRILKFEIFKVMKDVKRKRWDVEWRKTLKIMQQKSIENLPNKISSLKEGFFKIYLSPFEKRGRVLHYGGACILYFFLKDGKLYMRPFKGTGVFSFLKNISWCVLLDSLFQKEGMKRLTSHPNFEEIKKFMNLLFVSIKQGGYLNE